ncbi:MAG: hypothetical protein KC416_12230, partial [Myxococcales bacterium]|nr:hypothetical protein [Myxococcales bacterium]
HWTDPAPGVLNYANRILRRAGFRIRLRKDIDHRSEMTTIEHRINLFHLVDQVCAYGVSGAFVEIGCFIGETAQVIGTVMKEHGVDGPLFLFDSFEKDFGHSGADLQRVLRQNLERAQLKAPSIVAGRFEETLLTHLPDKIAFCHIDCGFGGDPSLHADVVELCLQQVYPKLSSRAIVALMDYHDGTHASARNSNPGARIGADRFLADKPEKMCAIFAGDGAQGYFRKQSFSRI